MSNVRSITPNDPANFTPEMGNYKTLQPFRYWCQKVLPLVYDDSLSYYELLCKVVDYLNKTMEDVETLHGDVTNLHTAYDELQSYVNNYFSTLDVQEEINNKLDNMASSGELYEIIRRYTDPIVNEQNEQINVLKARMDTFASLPDGSTAGDAELQDIRVGYNGKAYPSAGDAVREQVGELKGNLDKISTTKVNLLFNGILHDNAYYQHRHVDSEYYCYFEINVNQGETYIIGFDARFISKDGEVIYESTRIPKIWVADFTGKLYITYLKETINTNPWFVGYENYDYEISGSYQMPTLNENILKQTIGNSKSSVISQKVITDYLVPCNNGFKYASDSSAYASFPSVSLKNDYSIIARFEAVDFIKVSIGRGDNNDIFKSCLIIEPKKWYIEYKDSQHILRENNVDLKPQYFLIRIKVKNGNKADIHISYPNDGYIFEDVEWLGYNYATTFLSSENVALNNIYFGLNIENLDKKIWLFGDSYFNLGSSSWMEFYTKEYSNSFISGFGGATTQDAYNSLLELIKIKKPIYCCVCTGMNDPDTDGGINKSWLTYIQKIIEILEKNGVIPILSTIPTVPSRNNEYKNEWVRLSGYRYIDFYKAVGARPSGIWYDNMISPDNIHPSYRGSVSLYYQALADFPEITD